MLFRSYLMSSHPGSTLNDAIELALCLKRDHYAPEQVQDYYPTPGTASTVMYYTGINPLDMKPVYVATDYHEKQLQRALLQYNRPQNAPLVREALRRAGREDLIGFGENCLVKPDGNEHRKPQSSPANKGSGKSAGQSHTQKGNFKKVDSKNIKNTPKQSQKKTEQKSSPKTPNFKKGGPKGRV